MTRLLFGLTASIATATGFFVLVMVAIQLFQDQPLTDYTVSFINGTVLLIIGAILYRVIGKRDRY